MQQKHFTLLELLTVVAIIMILIAFLLPALSRAKEMAHIVTCKSNLKQIAGAAALYAADNNHQMLATYTNSLVTIDGTNNLAINRSMRWDYLLGKLYLAYNTADDDDFGGQGNVDANILSGKLGIYQCPSHSWRNVGEYSPKGIKGAFGRCYGISSRNSWQPHPSPGDIAYKYDFSKNNKYRWIARPIPKTSMLQAPDKFVLFMEIDDFAFDSVQEYGDLYNKKWFDGQFMLEPWHFGNINQTYPDGHVGHRRWGYYSGGTNSGKFYEDFLVSSGKRDKYYFR